MDIISLNEAATANGRIEKFIENPDSNSGVLTQPSVIQTGETVSIPSGRTAIMANTQIDGTLNISGEVFIPSGATFGDLESQIDLKAPLTSAALVNPTINGIAQSGYTGFKNLIINGKKVVNQSGLTVADNAYNYDNHYKVGNNWFQFIDGKNIVSGEPYTLSWSGVAIASYYIGTAGALTINAQTFIPIANGETITPTITSSQILWIKFASDASGSTYNKVQFEPGTVPTPYEHRLYELEESLVQSCVEKGKVYFDGYTAATGSISGTNTSYKAAKRITPILTFAFTNIINAYQGNTRFSDKDSFGRYCNAIATGTAVATETYFSDARPY